MGLRKMLLQRFIPLIEPVLVEIAAKMTRQVHFAQMIHKAEIVVEEFATKIAPRMWQDFRVTLICWISMIYVISQGFHVIDALFANEDGAPF